MHLSMLLDMAAEGFGDRVAFGSRPGGLTFAALGDQARRAGAWASARGVERVGLVDVNSEAVPILLYGSGLAGMPFVPVNYRLADEQLRAILLFTSGTTGEPKAAVLRHKHLASYVIGTVEFMGADEEEAALVSVPPYHVAGTSAVLTSAYAGRRVVYLPAFTPEGWVAVARDEQVTQAMVVPTMLGRILDVLEREGERLRSLR